MPVSALRGLRALDRGCAGRGAGSRLLLIHEPRASELVRLLLARYPEFTRLRELHEVLVGLPDHKTLVHFELGEMEVDCQILCIDNPRSEPGCLHCPA